MLCRRLNKILYPKSAVDRSSQYRCHIASRSKCSWINSVLSALKTDPMSSFRLRLFLRDLSVIRLWNAWSRTQLVSSVVKRCRRDRGVRDMLASFRQTFLRPSRTFLISATAAYKNDSTYDGKPQPCRRDITDEDLKGMIQDLDSVEQLSRSTLFCEGCNRRLIIDKKHPGVLYCSCPNTHPPGASEDGWMPYMEAEDVVIWRKEYKPNSGLYAYKVYGRYKDLHASDFAMVQVDGAYRRSWDDAVAALSIVEKEANGVKSQSVLHWEVQWPRLFSNRDYVYIRRHKQFAIKSRCWPHKEAIFRPDDPDPCGLSPGERPSVHSNAKRKGMEADRREAREAAKQEETPNNVYVIISRSCTHPEVPESSKVVRVHEYWSNMIIRTLDGPDTRGMEFVLTYYDEPTMPGAVASWAAGRGAPVFLARMHQAALQYSRWRSRHKEEPDFEPFVLDPAPVAPQPVPDTAPPAPGAVPVAPIDKGGVKDGHKTPKVVPKPVSNQLEVRDESTQTESVVCQQVFTETANKVILTEVRAEKPEDDKGAKGEGEAEAEGVTSQKGNERDNKEDCGVTKEGQSNELEQDEQKSSWWRYLYPFYYFV